MNRGGVRREDGGATFARILRPQRMMRQQEDSERHLRRSSRRKEYLGGQRGPVEGTLIRTEWPSKRTGVWVDVIASRREGTGKKIFPIDSCLDNCYRGRMLLITEMNADDQGRECAVTIPLPEISFSCFTFLRSTGLLRGPI